MMNTMKTRSRPVTQNRFLRRLMLHFDYLQDETSWMHQASTVIFLLVSLYVQTLPTNTRTDSCLNALLGNSKWVPAILVLGLVTPLVVICLLATSLFVENSLIDNHNNLETPTHLKSHWFVIYKHLYRFNFLLLEPIITGYMVSLILTVSKADEYGIGYTICAIIGGTLGFILNLAYLFFVESILPSQSLTCSTNRHNVALTTLSLRMCLALDRYFTYLDSQTIRAVVMCIRLIPSTVALYFNLFTTFFFLRHAKLFFSGYQISNIIYSITFFIEGGTSYGITIIPASLFIVLALRAVYNIDLLDKSSLRNLSARRLIDVITLCNHLVYKRLGVEELASMRGLRLQAVMAHTADSRFVQYEEFVERFASAEERIEDSEKNTHLFVTYLFERLWHDTGEKNFKVLIYETSWTLFMRPNLFHISLLLARLSAMEMSTIEQSTYRALLRRLEATCKEIYLDKQSLLPVKEQFYAPKSVAEINEAVAFKQKASINDDDSRDGAENTKQQGTTGKPDLLHFDVYSSMQTIEQYERLVGKMQEVISTILKFYDKLKNRVVEIASAHETMKTIKQLKESVTKSFRDLDRLSGEQNLFHLLPYALFLETINNDRQASQKILKVFEHRSQTFERNLMMLRDKSSYTKFNLDLMLCIGVDCTKNSLGRMNYVSSNCEEVFGVQPKSYEGRNVNCLMSDDFQTIHDEFMDKFVRDQNKPYLGVSRERHVRIREQVYTKCDVLVKLAPVLNPTSMSFMCLLKRHTSDEEFIVLNHQGVIVGRSQGLDWVDSYLQKSISALSSSLPYMSLNKARIKLLKNSLFANQIIKVKGLENNPPDLAAIPEFERIPRAGNSLGVGLVDNMNKLVADELVHIVPVSFEYGGFKKKIFTDLLLVFNGESLIKSEKLVKKPHPGAEIALRELSRLSIKSPEQVSRNLAGLTYPMTSELKNPSEFASGVSLGTVLLDPQTPLGKKAGLIKTFKKTDSSRFSSTIQEVESLAPNKTTRITYKISQKAETAKGNVAKRSQDQTEGMDVDVGQSSVRSSNRSGSMFTAQVKARVLAVMKRQRRHMAWKEILALILLQVLIWTACTTSLMLIDNNFNGELHTFISLRRGFGIIFGGVTACFHAGITMMDRMLVGQGLLSEDRYKNYLPYPHHDLKALTDKYLHGIQYWGLEQLKLITSFPFQYGGRYLSQTSPFKYHYSEDGGIEANATLTKTINMIDYYREAAYLIGHWQGLLEAGGNKMSLDNKYMGEFYKLQGDAVATVFGVTILLMMDQDTNSYKKVVARVELFSVITILMSIGFATLIVLVFYMLRRKSIGIYSLLECLFSFELFLSQVRLQETNAALTIHKFSESRMHNIVSKLSKLTDNRYQAFWMANNNSRKFLRKRIGFLNWFGLGRMSITIYAAIVVYQAVSYAEISKLSVKLSRLLELQSYSRSLTSANNQMSGVNFNAYFMAIRGGKLGSRGLVPYDAFNKLVRAYGKGINDFLSQVDLFVTVLPGNPEDSANWLDLLNDKPCDFLDYAKFGLSRQQCENLGDGSFGKSPMDVMRWNRHMIPGLVEKMSKLNETANPVSFLQSEDFLAFEFTRTNFNAEYILRFTMKFFDSLLDYHVKAFVTPIQKLKTSIFGGILLSIILTAISAWIIFENIDADLQVLLLVPPESYYHNPHIAAKLLTITR